MKKPLREKILVTNGPVAVTKRPEVLPLSPPSLSQFQRRAQRSRLTPGVRLHVDSVQASGYRSRNTKPKLEPQTAQRDPNSLRYLFGGQVSNDLSYLIGIFHLGLQTQIFLQLCNGPRVLTELHVDGAKVSV